MVFSGFIFLTWKGFSVLFFNYFGIFKYISSLGLAPETEEELTLLLKGIRQLIMVH